MSMQFQNKLIEIMLANKKACNFNFYGTSFSYSGAKWLGTDILLL
jgi:hypothetical protein